MTKTLLLRWLIAFAITEAIEVPIYLRALGGRSRSGLAIALGASAWTHPIVAFVIPALFALVARPVYWVPGETALTVDFASRALGFFAMAEGFAIVGEAGWLHFFGVAHPLRWSAVANITSSSTGAIITLMTGWP